MCDVAKIVNGSKPTDGGNLILEEAELNGLIKENPAFLSVIREYIGADEFLNNKKRYCFWLKACDVKIMKHPIILSRIEKVRAMRLASTKESTKKWAELPYLFEQDRQTDRDFLLIPRVSSERRFYIPIGFFCSRVVASDSVLVVPNAGFFHFGVLMSLMHNSWVRVVCGRLKSDYRYSNP